MFKFLSIGIASANVVTYFSEPLVVTPTNSILTFGFDDCTWCQEYTPIFVQAAEQYVGPLHFGIVQVVNKADEKYQIYRTQPTIMVFDAEGTETIYEGPFETQALVDFFNTIIVWASLIKSTNFRIFSF